MKVEHIVKCRTRTIKFFSPDVGGTPSRIRWIIEPGSERSVSGCKYLSLNAESEILLDLGTHQLYVTQYYGLVDSLVRVVNESADNTKVDVMFVRGVS